jgi:hypothetical protein
VLGPLARPITRLEPARALASKLACAPAAQPPPRYAQTFRIQKEESKCSHLDIRDAEQSLNGVKAFITYIQKPMQEGDHKSFGSQQWLIVVGWVRQYEGRTIPI